jgi:hypothetical protein
LMPCICQYRRHKAGQEVIFSWWAQLMITN